MRRFATLAVVTLATLVVLAGPAFAHLEAQPESVAANSTATIGFNVEHGCDGSPTIELQIKIPSGVTVASIPTKDGWAANQADGTLTWASGSLAADQASTFSAEFKIPDVPAGTQLVFPAVQTCQVGSIDWIQATVQGQDEPDHPAPAVEVTAAKADDGTSTTTEVAPITIASSTTVHNVAEPASDDAPIGLIIGFALAGVLIAGAVITIMVIRSKTPPDERN